MPIKKQLYISAFLILLTCYTNYAQEHIQVPFLSSTPKIDGLIDDELKQFQKCDFNYVWQFDNPPTDTVPVNYLVAYTPSHFYLHIETQADSINYRNRGFQNGDGFKLLFAIPQKDSLTDEFYELFFSPTQKKKYWARQKIWTYNIETVLWNFTEESKFEYKAQNGICGFEVLISWNDIPPYHPWMLDRIGFNLYFAKAIGDTITNGYAVVYDYGIWDEGVKRKFTPLIFEKPNSISSDILISKPQNRTIQQGDSLVVETATLYSIQKNIKLTIDILNDSSEAVYTDDFTLLTDNYLKKENHGFQFRSISPGNYKVVIRQLSDTISTSIITILPELNFGNINQELLENKQSLSVGTVNTLIFKLNQIQEQKRLIKPYERGKELLTETNRFLEEYKLFMAGQNPYEGITKPYRRAFQSKYDSTYQPYTVNLPEDYDGNLKYPLLVFLHGSGVDEQSILNKPRSNGKFIELAPFARDMYNCYSSDSSQNDILEAINDVIVNFSIDTSKIIIGGFSMGGYGALRTYYEHPDLYKGVAVFAGHPYLASDWLDVEHPDFLKKEYLNTFENKPVFIYHGRKDGSLPVNLIEQMNKQLESIGADVTINIAENKGHKYPDKETNKKYFEWLEKIIAE